MRICFKLQSLITLLIFLMLCLVPKVFSMEVDHFKLDDSNLQFHIEFSKYSGEYVDYDLAMARADFGDIGNRGTSEIRGLDGLGRTWPHRTKVGEGALRAHYPANIASGQRSGFIFTKNFTPSEEAVMEYRIKFDEDFKFCYGGKLPGLGGSVSQNGAMPYGGTENRSVVHSAFSTRLMWRRHENLVVYAYFPERLDSNGRLTTRNGRPAKWGEDIEFFRPVERGRWYTIRQYVKMNTPGERDGILEMYVDGKLVLRRTNIEYRLPGQDVKVNAAVMHTYRGGGRDDVRFQSDKSEHIYFDDIKVWAGGITPSVEGITPPVEGIISAAQDVSIFSSSTPVVVSEQKEPFTGEAVSLPGTIMAVEYDKGGEGVSYHDTIPENRGAQMRGVEFRPNDAVDVDNHPDGGYVIGWIAAGEWVEYTVNVTQAGEYELEFHTGSLNGGGSIGLNVDGEALLSGIAVPQTHDWHSYTTFSETVNLNAGEQIWRVNMENAGFNLHKIVVKSIR